MEDVERPVPDCRRGRARRGWRGRKGCTRCGGGHGHPSPSPRREDLDSCCSVCAPWLRVRAQIPLAGTANRASEMSGKPVRLGRKFDRQAGCLDPLHPLLCLVLPQDLCASFSLCLAPPLGLWIADSSFSSQWNIATSEKPPRVAGSHIRGSMSFVAELSTISGSPHLLLGPHVCCLFPQWLPRP